MHTQEIVMGQMHCPVEFRPLQETKMTSCLYVDTLHTMGKIIGEPGQFKVTITYDT